MLPALAATACLPAVIDPLQVRSYMHAETQVFFSYSQAAGKHKYMGLGCVLIY